MAKRQPLMKKKKTGGWVEFARTIFYALLIALGVRTFAYEPFNIPSGSMIPTLLVGDYLFVSKFSYGYSRYSMFGLLPIPGRILDRPPERGDVAVFRKPPENDTDFIKRIIGLPGDQIQVLRGILHINAKPVARQRNGDFKSPRYRFGVPQYIETLSNGRQHPIIEKDGDRGHRDNTRAYTVPPGHYFMMGDNRDDSADSREGWFVPAANLVGRAEFLFYSTDGRAALFEVWRWPTSTRWSRLFDGVR